MDDVDPEAEIDTDARGVMDDIADGLVEDVGIVLGDATDDALGDVLDDELGETVDVAVGEGGRGTLNLDKGTAPENKRRSPAPGCQSHRAESRAPPDIKDEGTTYVMLLNNVQIWRVLT